MSEAPAPALAANELTVELGGRAALEDVAFRLPPGASVALLGPNGAGKTTLLRAAVGLVRPSSGSLRRGPGSVAFVPQRLDVEPSFPATVADVVRMGRYGELGWLRRFGDRDRALVSRAIEELGIGPLAGRRFGDLSGGERQRALLAQATAQDARLLLLDEPFAGLDAPTNQVLRERIRRWRDEGRTIVVATHDLQSASRDYDLVICLNRRLVAIGRPAEACTEEVLAETFAGRVVRVGDLLIDTAHHHHGAG
ncbi:MAG: metal ABC transporter ATP-binding protein [Deltaproteobacteria bacterium]|nr:metal ABC transporter ATP-binding protein [Deltaproteobacteria bacterium]